MKFFDGAFGTYYIAKTGDYGPCELANLNAPEVVLGIHKEYIASGVNAITTNTFRANPATFDDETLLRRVIGEGWRLAQTAASGVTPGAARVDVFADIGGINDEETAQEQYCRVTALFLELGAENFIFETLPGFTGVAEAASAIKAHTKASTVIASFAVSQAGYAGNGAYYQTLIEQAANCDAIDVVGLNCVCGPTHLLELSRALSGLQKPLLLMPNAGYPTHINGRLVFQDNAEYFAEKMREIYALGIRYLGGCCGTSPEHIRRMITAVSAVPAVSAVTTGISKTKACKVDDTPQQTPRLAPKPLLVELDPPMDGSDSDLLSAASRLKAAGVQTITLADSPLSRARADSVLTAARVKSAVGIDVMPHITCRDKNSIALRGALLGAHFFGIEQVLVVTGDPLIDAGKSFAVFHFNSTQLISYIHTMNRDVFQARRFRIGAALNVNAANFKLELARAQKKCESGAEFMLTQPIFSSESIENFKTARRELDCALYAGIMPLAGYKNAVFLNNEVPGIKIPPEILSALQADASAGCAYSADIIHSVYDYADGFYIMMPLKKVGLVCELIERCFDRE